MKKVLILAAVLLIGGLVSAQEEEKSESKTVAFMQKDGTLLQRETYPLTNIKKFPAECEVLIIKDVVSGSKMGCMRIETSYYIGSGQSSNYIGTLDYDEIDACIQSLQYIMENVLPNPPAVYTEYRYRTRDGLEIGVYWSNGKQWQAYVQPKHYSDRSMKTFDPNMLPELISVMQEAKVTITNNTK